MRIIKFTIFISLIVFLGNCSAGDVKKTSSLPEGTAADFTLADQNGKSVQLSDVLKKYSGAVIAFYPKDDTKK